MTTSIVPTPDFCGVHQLPQQVIAGAQFDLAAGFLTQPLAAVASGSSLAETVLGTIGSNGLASFNLGQAIFTPSAAFVASNSAYFTITINKRTAAAPATAVAIAIGSALVSGANFTGSGTQWKGVALTVQTTSALLAGDTITIAVTQVGGGLNMPAGSITLIAN